MSVHVGTDVHHERSQIAAVEQLPIGAPVAAYSWGQPVRLPADHGFEPHLVHPLRCKAIASAG